MTTKIKQLLQDASALALSEEYQEALILYDKILKIDPKNLDALTDKATTLQRIGKNSEALDYYQKVLQVNPKNIDALIGKGASLHAQKNTQMP